MKCIQKAFKIEKKLNIKRKKRLSEQIEINSLKILTEAN